MTYFRPSNYKLIDRCVRYISHLLDQKGIQAGYDDIVAKVFHSMEQFPRRAPPLEWSWQS